jgi:hypothetical protein
MRRICWVLAIGWLLAGCNQHEASTAGPKSPGRYAGIGTFDAGRLWQQMKGSPASQDPAAAKLADDEHVIVVLDSHTGEIRQCGDHSGFCVAMHPWADGSKAEAAPVKLTKHAAELDAEAEKEAAPTDQARTEEARSNSSR